MRRFILRWKYTLSAFALLGVAVVLLAINGRLLYALILLAYITLVLGRMRKWF
jgi:hypothetical protein